LHKPSPAKATAVTSDLSIDETLLLHSVGWEPVDLVFGASIVSVPAGVWNWGNGEIVQASEAHTKAVEEACRHTERQCSHVKGFGVVGVGVDVAIHPHHIDVRLLGTAVRPTKPNAAEKRQFDTRGGFISDLSARDFVLLRQAGWAALGLTFGTSFVYAPRRSAGTVLQQKGQNVELTNLTTAMYAARESAMERMQASALSLGGQGVVAVRVNEGPVTFASHSIQFSAIGTAVSLATDAHQYCQPQVVLPLDDILVQFDATSLRH
jgi:uncharacterized protein YbjQ (UPF0145 family)